MPIMSKDECGTLNKMKTKSRLSIALLVTALLCCWRVALVAQTAPPKDGRYFERQAVQAYRNKDFSAYLANLKIR